MVVCFGINISFLFLYMATYFRGKYRIESSRFKYWNYGANGYYFVTICTKNRERFFGQIKNGKMMLSEIGVVAEQCWRDIPSHFPFVWLDQWVVMPDHVHGIIIIDKTKMPIKKTTAPAKKQSFANVETQNLASLYPVVDLQGYTDSPPLRRARSYKSNKFGPQSQNVASINRGFKIGVKKWAVINNVHFQWQPRYHDWIIRDENVLHRIRNYIVNNPSNWVER